MAEELGPSLTGAPYFSSVTQAAWLTEARLAAFLRRMGYPGRKAAAELLDVWPTPSRADRPRR